MSKKSDLLDVIKDETYHLKQLGHAFGNLDEYSVKYHAAELLYLGEKFDYIAGDKAKQLEDITDPILTQYNCNEDKLESYIENLNSGEVLRCVGIYEIASIEAVEQLF